MDANDFVLKFKANGSESDWTDLDKVFDDYKNISTKLSEIDRGSFSLNVLCILCRNLDKVPSWKHKINNTALLHLSIDCARATRASVRTDRIKTLACIYHIQKHVVKQNCDLPPELVLKLSFMPFENDTNHLLNEYSKTYWNILADRISYLEKLKLTRSIIKLFPKLIEDITKVIHIYDTAQFCINILTFVIKKLHCLYSDCYSKDLNDAFGKIFEQFTIKNDVKKIKSHEALEMYVKLNDCLYVIAENTLKCDFNETVLSAAVRSSMVLLGTQSDLFHCLQTVYLNSFCAILTNKNPIFLKSIINSLYISCDTSEKLGYERAMKVTYPYINQLIRIYIEHMVNNCEFKKWSEHFTDTLQEIILKLINLLMKKLGTATQMLKCDGCNIKSGLHDALRSSFLVKNFITISLNQKIKLNKILPSFYTIVQHQHEILKELRALGCTNYDKCYRKLQTDIHNVAISLNKAQYFEFSIKIFNLYLKNEIQSFKTDAELKNISRALYNKSICELDDKKFSDSLHNAYLSLIFALPDSLSSAKYMSLVLDIKAKALKHNPQENEPNDQLQLTSILDACDNALQNKVYGNLRPFLKHLKFSELLKHEFQMYSKLWPSIVPVAGVWRSLYRLCKGGNADWISEEPKEVLHRTLYETIVHTTTAVRTIHCEYYIEIIDELIKELDEEQSKNPELWIVEASLYSIKCEYNLAEASVKYGWKTKDNTDPEQCNYNRTLQQEYTALLPAFKAVDIWTRVWKNITLVPDSKLLRHALKIASIVAHELNYCHQTAPAMQMAYICVIFGIKLNDNELQQQSLSLLLPHMHQHIPEISRFVVQNSISFVDDKSIDTAIEYMANVAMHYSRRGKLGLAATILQMAQGKLLNSMKNHPGLNLEFAIGRVTFAQLQICPGGQSLLTHINSLQRHYLGLANNETTWAQRRLTSLRRGILLYETTAVAASALRSLHAWSRAAAASAVNSVCSAVNSVLLGSHSVCVDRGEVAQVKIDNCLKHILGIQNFEPQPYASEPKVKPQLFTPKNNNLETMLENMVFKRTQISPSIPCESVPGYRTPTFLNHTKDCDCYACMTPLASVLACKISGLESAVYFKAKEMDIARNYFSGTLNMFGLVQIKLKDLLDKYREKYEEFIIDLAVNEVERLLSKIQIEILLETAYFELAQKNYEKSDDYIVRIHEIMQQYNVDEYLKNEIMNLMIVSAQMRNLSVKLDLTDLELEMELLELTPTKEVDPPKTPEIKASKPPKIDKKIVNEEEVPKLKRKFIKLNLDDKGSDTPDIKPTTRSRHVFKIPVPVTNKPIPEAIPSNTPKPKSKVHILLTQPSEDLESPQPGVKPEFFTPLETPSEKFFTPLTAVKTYGKQSLRQNIVKNLDNEFSTPKTDEKENNTSNAVTSKTRRIKLSDSKRYLKRVTSPGKLVKEDKKPLARPKRLQRSNINFSLDEDK